MHTRSFFSLLCIFLFFPKAGAVFGYGVVHCQITTTNDVVYLTQVYFNKVLLIQYNSTAGYFTSYTEKTKDIVDNLNKNPTFLKQERKNEEICRNNIQAALSLFSKPVEPYVSLKSVEAASSRHPAMLMCSVYNFFPKQIRVSWLRDGREVTSDVTSTEQMSNGNWLYQIHSFLEYTPRIGERITCMVDHASLSGPKLYDWDPYPASVKNKIAVGVAGLLLGLVVFIAGIIFFKKSSPGRSLVPTS